MLIKYNHTDFFIASDCEFSRINLLDDYFSFLGKKEVFPGFGGFEMVVAVSRIFFDEEVHIPNEIDKNLPDVSRIFQYEQDFVENISSFERQSMDLMAYRLRGDKYCRKNEFSGMGLWSFLYELFDCCSLAIKKNKNLYLVEYKSEYIFQK
jgi:hypothetical protein